MPGVRRADSTDLTRAAQLLGSAFADYPWTRWCVDGNDHVGRITQLQHISLEVLGFPFGLVWVAEVEDEIVSVAVWSDSRTMVDRSLFTELTDRSRPLHGDRLTFAIEAETGGHPRPTAEHLFLETMGTHPERQRHGYGAAVLQPGLELADQQQLLCGLETSTDGNVEFYRTVGFETVDHRVIPGDGPDVWTMWRQPR